MECCIITTLLIILSLVIICFYNSNVQRQMILNKSTSHICLQSSKLFEYLSPSERIKFESHFRQNDQNEINKLKLEYKLISLEYETNQLTYLSFDSQNLMLSNNNSSSLDIISNQIMLLETGKASADCTIDFKSFDDLYMKQVKTQSSKDTAETLIFIRMIFDLLDAISKN